MEKHKLFIFFSAFLIFFLCVFVVFIDRFFVPPATPLDSVLDAVKGSNETYADENGILAIVEFSDFDCPYCKSVVPTLRKLKANYGAKINIIFKQFPVHGTTLKAEASECARDQNRFWEMHDLLFADQSEITADTLLDYAARMGISKKQFEECLSSGKKKSVIKKDMAEGQRKGVSGTPTFFIGSKMIPGAMPYDTFAGIIDEELKNLEASGSGEENE